MSSLKVPKAICIDLNVGDQLTSISCSHIVAELVKFIAYQRLQIPYTYQWLKQIVNKKKCKQEQGLKDNLQSEKHFRTASTALENLDYILKVIKRFITVSYALSQKQKEAVAMDVLTEAATCLVSHIISDFNPGIVDLNATILRVPDAGPHLNRSLLQEICGPSMPQEVCITLGATPVTCKEVYRFLLPTLCHKPQCHSTLILKDQKLQCNVFRALVTSEALSQAFCNSLPPTNMHVFMRKKVANLQDKVLNSDNFLPASGSRIPKSSKMFIIDFRNANNDNVACCNNFEIFGDVISDDLVKLQINDKDEELYEIQSTDSLRWFQSTYVMKGFKDCIVDGSSITNAWLEA